MSSDGEGRQNDELNWDLFQADLKVSKMAIKVPRPELNFDIPVIPQPSRYRPGSGPSSGPLTLRLEDDSTAFIVDKVILPLEPFTRLGDPRQRRPYYIIGWPDLPAARPVVDCAKALDYVSPYAIEEWEYKDFLRREVEKEQAETEAALAAVAQAIAAEKGKGVAGADLLPNGKKKPGRKPKNARLLNARPPTPQLDSEQEELLAKRRQGPSLSTPQKTKGLIAQLDAETGMGSLHYMGEDLELDEEIRRQLESEDLREVPGFLGAEDNEMDLLGSGTGLSGVASTNSAKMTPPEDRVPQNSGNSLPILSRSIGASPIPLPIQPHRPPVPVVSSRLSHNKRPISTTPIPLPQRPGLGSRSRLTPSSNLPSVMPSTEKRAPATQGHATQPANPVYKSYPDAAPSTSHHPQSSNGVRGGFTPTNSFTSVHGSSFPRPEKRPAHELPFARDDSQSKSSSGKIEGGRKKKARKLLQPPTEQVADPNDTEPQAEQEYVVKRLEDDILVDGVQYFKVRWEGDWPPDQNPTWEPRENISARLLTAYLKRKAGKLRKTPSKQKDGKGNSTGRPKDKHQSTLNQWASQLSYNSVSEAFEGRAELDQINGKGAEHEDEPGRDTEEFLVVDKRKAEERDRAAAERRKSLTSQLAAELANARPGSDF